jgi:hypothetical protein
MKSNVIFRDLTNRFKEIRKTKSLNTHTNKSMNDSDGVLTDKTKLNK